MLKFLLYNEFKVTVATNYGKEKESDATKQFVEETGLQVTICELFVEWNKNLFPK